MKNSQKTAGSTPGPMAWRTQKLSIKKPPKQ